VARWPRIRRQVAQAHRHGQNENARLPVGSPYARPETAKWGAFHTSEVPYAMNTLYTSDRPFSDVDRKIAEMMSSYWVNLAADGDPNGHGLPHWPAVDEKPLVMEVGDRNEPVPLAGNPAKVHIFCEVPEPVACDVGSVRRPICPERECDEAFRSMFRPKLAA
jgi:carboxylesterase type B